MVTGATGYVAGWIVRTLLDDGLRVHAAIRNPSKVEKREYLDEIAKQSSGSIEYFDSDLLVDGSYADAMDQCELVYHTASPFSLNVDDPQKDLVDPAIIGTRNVLTQANNSAAVKRVVVTSSVAAIYGDNIDIANSKEGILTEADWNETSSLEHQPYSFSKTQAEKTAWEICDAQDRWQLITVNPSLVIGPGVSPKATSESFNLMKQFGDGTFKMGVPDLGVGVVDVRDVAKAHVAAGFNADASGRYIASGHDTSFPQMAKLLREEFADRYPIPNRTLPKWLLWLIGPFIDKSLSRKMIGRNVGYEFHADNSKSRSELGITYRPQKESLVAFFQQLIDSGALPKASQ
jgi:dihydroflavonol-4-reductase